MDAGGLAADEQSLGDLTVGAALDQHTEYLKLHRGVEPDPGRYGIPLLPYTSLALARARFSANCHDPGL
jgi:hypothetical protein